MDGIPPATTTITARLALPLVSALRASGHDLPRVLAKVGLREEELKTLHGRLSLGAFLDFHAATVDETGDAAFPLEAVSQLDREAFPLGFYLMGSQTTLRDGYSFVRPYRHVLADGIEFTLVEEGREAYVDFELHGAPLGPPVFAEYMMAAILALGRLLTPEGQAPTEVVFVHRIPRHGEAGERFFGAPVRYGGEAVRFVFPNPRIDQKIAGADPHLGQLLARQIDEFVPRGMPSQRMRDRVSRFFSTRLERGDAVLEEVAVAMKMSDRTLRRRLAAEGTSASMLLDAARKERGIALVEEGATPLDEVAFLLGYSGASAFRRAFKRWTGIAPSRYGR